MTLPDFLKEQLESIVREPSLIQQRGRDLAAQWVQEPEDAADWMELMLATERLVKINVTGKANDAALLTALEPAIAQSWRTAPPLPCNPIQPKRIGELMLREIGLTNKEIIPQDIHLRIYASFSGQSMIRPSVQYCLDHGITCDIEMDDSLFDTILANHLSLGEVEELESYLLRRCQAATHAMNFRYQDPGSNSGRDSEKFKILDRHDDFMAKQVGADKVRGITTLIPSAHDAAIDGFSYPDYIQYYFDSCDQPWELIKSAQQKLIDAFNKGNDLHITNSDGTDIRMSLAGHTFANSVIARNMPGSEFFSAPVRESVNGTLIAKGNFAYLHNGVVRQMKDITLKIEHGRIMEAHAAEGNEALNEIISSDDTKDPTDPNFEGARHIGEIGIGTNPFIQDHLVNRLLVEKISGSFHMAVGRCYGNRYLGEETLMDNGNKSDVHWDITTMLRGKEGRMELDGHLIQKNGEWIGCPELGIKAEDVDVLNRGWAAVPESQRPKYWRDKLAASAPDMPKH